MTDGPPPAHPIFGTMPTSFGPVQVWRLLPSAATALLIEPAGSATADPAPEDERSRQRWNELCAANPRLHDGPIWAVRGFDARTGAVHVSPERYRSYAIRPAIGTGVSMLAVRGVLLAHNAQGIEHVLLGQRSAQTRIYGDLWEVIPGGGMPGGERTSLPTVADLIGHLRQEAREEAGLDLSADECHVAGICHDTYAGGFDVLVRAKLHDGLESIQKRMGERDWEHRQVRWMPVTEIPEFDARQGGGVSPPTRAIFRFMGWVGAA